jgi:uncharacterized protein (UPF0303 family)
VVTEEPEKSEEPSWIPAAQLLADEERLMLPSLSHEEAWDLGNAFVAVGRSRELPIVVSLTARGQRVFHVGLPGSSADNDDWVRRKGNVVERFGHSSLLVGQQCRDAGTSFEERYGLPEADFAAHGGAFPLRLVDEGLIGVVVVSGLPQVDDHRLAVEVLGAHVSR